MKKRWVMKKEGDPMVVQQLAQQLKIDLILANILVQRGIKTPDEARAFFKPDYKDLYDPFLMKDMDKAVARIETAIANKEKVLVFGDYDVDGTTAVAMIYKFFESRITHLFYYVPDRETEGYGISFKGIEFAQTNGVSLIIALDCGIKETEKIKHAKQLGIDFIICDHHNTDGVVPPAIAVLDPKREDCPYPYKELSGCGVGFKLLQAYCKKNNIAFSEIEEYIDLVAVSIASDIVPINGENRTLAYFGLQKLNANPSIGLKSIIRTVGMENSTIYVSDIVFKIGPRINAAGRVDVAKKSVALLISENQEAADNYSEKINKFNITRKELDGNITEEILKEIQRKPEFKDCKSTVVYNKEWHKGVLGIVASRLTETYYRPTVVLTESNGLACGSARSVDGYDLYAAISSCSDLLVSYGGHMYAAGLTLEVENVPKFKQRFEEFVANTINPELLIPKIDIDAKINLKDINQTFFKILKHFEPFGPENMTPVFATFDVTDSGYGKIVGNTREHIKFDVVENHSRSFPFPAIGFNLASHIDTIKNSESFDICYTIEENVFRGQTNLQLIVRDIRERNAE